MDGQMPFKLQHVHEQTLGSHEASPVWQLLPIPGHQPASSLTLKKWHQAYPSTFATFRIGFWFWGVFSFVFFFFDISISFFFKIY